MNRKVILALCTVALATSAVAAGSRGALGESLKARFRSASPASPTQKPATAARAAAAPTKVQQQPPTVPEHAVYNEFFFHVNFLRKKAAKEEASGKESAQLRNFYKRQAKLDDKQNALIDKAAADLERELEAMDQKADKIIKKFRADVQAMDIKPGQRPPDPPGVLKTMQAERDALIVRAREGLHASLGAEAFGRLDQYVQQNIAPRMKAERLDRPRPENPNRPR